MTLIAVLFGFLFCPIFWIQLNKWMAVENRFGEGD